MPECNGKKNPDSPSPFKFLRFPVTLFEMTPSTCLTLLLLAPAVAFAETPGPEAPSCHPDEHPAAIAPAAVSAPAPRKPVMAAGPYVPPTRDNLVISEKHLPNGHQQKIVLFKNILIDKIYPSMGGPWSRAYVPMSTPHSAPSYIWITRYRAEVLDSVSGKPAQEFMCHTKLDLAGGAGAPPELKGVRSQFVISQGQNEASFPKGYALRVESHPDRQIDINIMVLNNNLTQSQRHVDFKATVDYVDEKTAREKKWIPLFETAASVMCPLTQCENASYSGGTSGSTGHWLVPPGRQEVRMPIGPLASFDTTIHYMMMHLHPYAESIELRDLTTGQTLWKGTAKNDSKEALLLSTDYYSSRKGLPVYKDHRYEVVSTYNNPTPEPVDAMASLWMYLKEKS